MDPVKPYGDTASKLISTLGWNPAPYSDGIPESSLCPLIASSSHRSLQIGLVLGVGLRREPGQPVVVHVQPQRIHAGGSDVDPHVELVVVDRVRSVDVVLRAEK